MDIDGMKKTDVHAVVFFECSDKSKIYPDNYFDCIDLVRPLFENSDFLKTSPGFYINIGDEERVRLTCITNDPGETNKIIRGYSSKESAIKLIPGENGFGGQDFNPGKISGECTEEYLNRRKFFTTYTQIALDLLKNYGRQCSRRLVAKWRLDYFFQGESCRKFFEPVFKKHSNFFNDLGKFKSYSIKQFWEDLDFNNDWSVHLLINMLLPADLHVDIRGWVINLKNFNSSPKFKEDFLHSINLDIPDNWEQNC